MPVKVYNPTQRHSSISHFDKGRCDDDSDYSIDVLSANHTWLVQNQRLTMYAINIECVFFPIMCTYFVPFTLNFFVTLPETIPVRWFPHRDTFLERPLLDFSTIEPHVPYFWLILSIVSRRISSAKNDWR